MVTGAGTLLGEGGNDTLTSTGVGRDTVSGGDGNDSITAGPGADSITGDAGNDTIVGSASPSQIAGGAGADRFEFFSGPTATLAALPHIIDWTGAEDTLTFLGFNPNFADLTSITAADYATAVSMANTLTTTQHFSFVAVQVGQDLILFAGASGGLSAGVDLVGRSMADFTSHNLI